MNKKQPNRKTIRPMQWQRPLNMKQVLSVEVHQPGHENPELNQRKPVKARLPPDFQIPVCKVQGPQAKCPKEDIDEIHMMIHTNLQLLKDSGRKIDFEKGMFKERNLPDFENVGYALLMIIDPSMCKKNIQWPLFDTSRKVDFRRKFTQCIKFINLMHSDAQIPEMNASSLQAPGGSAFLNFMLKLSTFALKIELGRMSGLTNESEVNNYALLRQPTKGLQIKDAEVFFTFNKQICIDAEKKRCQYSSYLAEALPNLTILSQEEHFLNYEVGSYKTKMEASVKSSGLEDNLTESLLNIDDDEVMKDWNKETEMKLLELEQAGAKLARLKELSSGCAKLLCSTRGQPAVVDAIKLTGERVSLAGLLRGGRAAAEALRAPSPGPSSPLVASARRLLPDVELVRKRAERAVTCARERADAARAVVDAAKPVLYEEAKKTEMPSCLDFLDLKISLSAIEDMTKETLLSTSTSILATKKDKGVKRTAGAQSSRPHLITSVKRRRSPGLVPARTAPRRSSFIVSPSPRHPLLPTNLRRVSVIGSPACRKSLYRKLPTGSKPDLETPLPLETEFEGSLKGTSSFSQYTSSSLIHNPFLTNWRTEESSASGLCHSTFIESFEPATKSKLGSIHSINNPQSDFTSTRHCQENSSLLANSGFTDIPDIKRSTCSENLAPNTDDSACFSFVAPLPKSNFSKTTHNDDCSFTSTPIEQMPLPNLSRRKSFENLVKRFQKVKQSMQKSSKE